MTEGRLPSESWVVICGAPDAQGNVSILKDSIPDVGCRHLVFRSREAAEREAKQMNKIRQNLKLTDEYKACKLKNQWMEGLLWHISE